jgi:hypothetical protein
MVCSRLCRGHPSRKAAVFRHSKEYRIVNYPTNFHQLNLYVYVCMNSNALAIYDRQVLKKYYCKAEITMATEEQN